MREQRPSKGIYKGQSTRRFGRVEEQGGVTGMMSPLELDAFKDSAIAFLRPLKHLLGVTAGFVIISDSAKNQADFLWTDAKGKSVRREITLPALIDNLREKALAGGKVIYRNLLPGSTHITVKQSNQIQINNILLLPVKISNESTLLYGFVNKAGKFTPGDVFEMAACGKFINSLLLNKPGFHAPEKPGKKSGGTTLAGQRRGISDEEERKRIDEETEELRQRALTSSHLASIGELASGIAHEVNNPLASIVLYAQLLMEEDLPAKTKNDIISIYESAQRAINIIRRLLTFARQQLQQKMATDINDMLAVTLELRKYALETSNIRVRTRLAPGLPMTLADAGQIQQVFLNIVLNAEAEMKLGHGKGNLLITSELVDNTIKVSFTDDGPGITRENMSKIFHPFFTTREVGEGTGLGLSICYGILADHDGRIYAESEPGKGATFHVELPVIPCRKTVTKGEPEKPHIIKSGKRRILIVDDEVSILDSLSRLLVKQGYTVETVDNCLPALDMILSQKYDFIFLDIKLPGMSGIELYREIEKADASIVRRIAFLTGNIMEKETRQFLQENQATYFLKPFVFKQLIKELDALLSREDG
jgi:signal transduction histidine kinase/CheY-like chemotaxis protein